jgi:uncharacterized protein YeaO (DUF488 family)
MSRDANASEIYKPDLIMPFQIKRAYEAASVTDGSRILVDRLWPRGVKKSTAHLCDWMKDIAPSPALRIWFDHRPDRFVEFRRRYKEELSHNALVPKLRDLGRDGLVTLVYGARDPLVNHARVLRDALQGDSTQPTKLTESPTKISKASSGLGSLPTMLPRCGPRRSRAKQE